MHACCSCSRCDPAARSGWSSAGAWHPPACPHTHSLSACWYAPPRLPSAALLASRPCVALLLQVAPLLPASGLVKVGTVVAERLLYAPCMGLATMAGYAALPLRLSRGAALMLQSRCRLVVDAGSRQGAKGAGAVSGRRWRAARALTACAVLGLLGARTWMRCHDWADSDALMIRCATAGHPRPVPPLRSAVRLRHASTLREHGRSAAAHYAMGIGAASAAAQRLGLSVTIDANLEELVGSARGDDGAVARDVFVLAEQDCVFRPPAEIAAAVWWFRTAIAIYPCVARSDATAPVLV